jgi:aminoglycoside phosphotransferase family enzyme/predicted kinase
VTTGPRDVPIVEALLRPEAYPPPRPARVDLVATHISWVFLTAHDVWKVKRPVDYGFVDYSTLDRRRHFCLEEVRLNERLAPGVYRGVVPIRLGPDGPTLSGEGPIVDYAVRMRRLPDAASLEARLRLGALTHEQLWAVAARLASFYAAAAARPAFASAAAIGATIGQNLEEARPFIGQLVSQETFDAVRTWQLGFLEREAGRFEDRAAHERVREGHGDLRLEHVYFDDSTLVIIDCVEFNERFRAVDVAADAGFLAMELDARGRPDLAGSFLGRFALESNDYDLYDVLDFYLAYRAWVRAKVAALLAVDPSTPPDKAARKAGEARALFALAESYTRPRDVRAPVVAVGGLIGAGKTVLAEAAARALGLPVIESDRTRKWLAGVAPTERAPDAAYEPEFSHRTFDEVFRRAALVLQSGRGVILDATFRGAGLRNRARELARRHRRRFLFVEAVCDDAVLVERLRRRAAGPSVSDATEELLARMRAEFEPVTELPRGEHLVVETDQAPDQLAEVVRTALAQSSGGPPA